MKFPNYLFLLRQVAAQYPDARFVMTHRDPMVVIPSACSVVFASRKRRLPNATLDPITFGGEILEHFVAGVTQALVARAAIGEDRFIDVGKHELEIDPTGSAERIYNAIDMELNDEVRLAHLEWAKQNGPGTRSHHHYSLEEFGLTPDVIRHAFATYLDAFGNFTTANV